MLRPYPLFLFIVLGFAEYAQPQTVHEDGGGVVLWLCVIPLLVIVTAAIISIDRHKQKNHFITRVVPVLSVYVILASWSVAVLSMSWMQTVRLYLGDTIVLDEVVIVLPAILALAMVWFVTGQSGSRMEWTIHRMRVDVLLLLIPVVIILAIQETVVYVGYTEFQTTIEIGSIALILIFAPLLIAWILPAHAIEDQAIKASVLAIGTRAGVQLHRVLVWNTHQRLMNALAIGVIPWWRTVVLSDKLITHVTQQELHAVTSHEIGHHRFRHALFLFLVVFGVLCWTDWFLSYISPSLGEMWFLLAQLLLMLFVLVLVARQFERQADTYAAVDLSIIEGSQLITASASKAMSDALGAIAWVHRIPVDRFEPIHGSIESRQRYVTQLIGSPVSGLPIDRHVRMIKLLIMILFVSGIIL